MKRKRLRKFAVWGATRGGETYTRDVKQGWVWLDVYLHVADPDRLAAEFSSRDVPFFQPLKDGDDGGRGFAVQDADGYVLYFGHPD